MSRIRRGTNGLFVLAVTVALGFGATQAVAAPGAAASAQACSKAYFSLSCGAGSATPCANYCAQQGFAYSECGDDPYVRAAAANASTDRRGRTADERAGECGREGLTHGGRFNTIFGR